MSPAVRPAPVYLPVRVSTFTFSPVLMKQRRLGIRSEDGIRWTLFAESPRMPSGASVTSESRWKEARFERPYPPRKSR